ncbi:MAG: rhomboid family intramembrane serine protease [Flavobacteriaceae bacterium]|nr:rhomboid family intramembrane serine protease [Flavobacteriaceae bacterium]
MRNISETIKALIIVNVIFFIGSSFLGDVAYKLFALFFYENPNFRFWQPLSHMFMHGGIMHIAFNMYALWAFGSPLEQIWGRKKFLFFYFSAGFGAALIHTLANYYQVHSASEVLLNAGMSSSEITNMLVTGQYNSGILNSVSVEIIQSAYNSFNTPAVGASGAIYGILVAFGMMFPNAELMLMFFPVPIKAKYFIPLLLIGDLVFGISGASTGIAHFAHLGGALFGFIMSYYWKKNSFDSHRWN